MSSRKRKEKINFLLDSSEAKKIHLFIYLITVVFILVMYLIAVTFFEDSIGSAIVGSISFIIGLGMIFYRSRIAAFISQKQLDKRVSSTKKEGRSNLKRTLRDLAPKPKKKVHFKVKITLKERFEHLLKPFKKKSKKSPDYIEVED